MATFYTGGAIGWALGGWAYAQGGAAGLVDKGSRCR